MKRMDRNEQPSSGEQMAAEDIGLRRVEALLRASSDWEPDSPARAGLAWDALRTRRKSGFATWAASLFPARPALVGVGASAVLAAGAAAFLWFAAGGTGNAPVSDAAITAAITEVGQQINNTPVVVAQSANSQTDSAAGDNDSAKPGADAVVKTPAPGTGKQRKIAAAGAGKARTGAASTPQRSRRSKPGTSGNRRNDRDERRLGVPIPMPRRPKAILANDTATRTQKNARKAPAALWKTETVQQYTYGAGTPVLVEQPGEDGSVIMVPAVALSENGETTPYDPTIDSE